MTYFLHDAPPEVLSEGPPPAQRPEAQSVFGEPSRFERWPSIPIRVIASENDRFFPLKFQQRVARDR